jgi:phosphoribosylglycinamide formyltransferase-1
VNDRPTLAILLSGEGTTMRAIVEASRDGRLGLNPTLVLSDRDDAPGLVWARAAGVRTAVLSYRDLGKKNAEKRLDALLAETAPAWIALAGFMRVLGPDVVRPRLGRMVNIHPSLLPRYPGLDTYRRALEAGEREHGSTVHFVDESLDGGPRIAFVRVPVRADDDPGRLAARTKAAERKLYPWVLDRLACGILRWDDGKVRYGDTVLDDPLDATAWLMG